MAASKPMPKQAHKSLSVEEKILDQMGEKSYKVLSMEYRHTISDIKKRGPELRAYKRKMADKGQHSCYHNGFSGSN